MHHIVVLGAIAATVSATVLPKDAQGNVSSITQTQPAAPLTFEQVMRKTAAKYGVDWTPPTQQQSKSHSFAAKQSNTSVSWTSIAALPQQYDSAYYCPVDVGGTIMMLDFDTGSSDLWVYGSELSEKEKAGHAIYPDSGELIRGSAWNITYADGSGSSGVIYKDNVTIGGATAYGQFVESANATSVLGPDGLLGLAFDAINTCQPNKCRTFMDTVGPTLKHNLFAVALKKGKVGTYDFGFIDAGKFTGDIVYTPVITGASRFWNFTADGFAVGPSTNKTQKSFDALADTGTSIAFLPEGIVFDYWLTVPGAEDFFGYIIYPCNATLPDFSVIIGGEPFTVPGDYLAFSPVSVADGYCLGGLQDSATLGGINILGDSFLKAVYAVFDVQNLRLGFATPSSY